jgi:hypothetical protein
MQYMQYMQDYQEIASQGGFLFLLGLECEVAALVDDCGGVVDGDVGGVGVDPAVVAEAEVEGRAAKKAQSGLQLLAGHADIKLIKRKVQV